MFDRVLNLRQVPSIPGFWIYLCSECVRVLNMPRFRIYQGSEYAGVTQGSEYAWIFSRHAFYIIELGTKIISKNVILLPQKALWTILKLSRKVENYYAIVKENSSVAGFLAHFAHFPLPCNLFTLIRGLLWEVISETHS